MNFDTTNDPRSIDFSYRKYSLEQLDNWVNDALNCEDLTPQDIYDTVVKCVDESVEYHKKHLTKSIELLSLLKETEFERKRTMLDAQSTNFPDYTELPDD